LQVVDTQETTQMAWVLLVIAGLFEIGWAGILGLKLTHVA
jgi:multidrug transporter EmrE-like cation transporter